MKNNTTKVSVIMLAYNHEPFIEQALNSVLEQETNFPYEILIGDDSSTDKTSKIIEEYANRYPEKITALNRPQNLGATRNLFDLITRAQGEYIAYLECDDYWTDKSKLQKQFCFLESNPRYIGCTHKISLVDSFGKPYSQSIFWISDKAEYTIADFGGIVLPGHGNSLMHRNIFREDPHKFENLITMHPLIADRSLCLLLAAHGPIYQIQTIMGCYRKPSYDRKSATTLLYGTNPTKTWDDYVFTKKLEAYAQCYLPTEVNFEPHKKKLLLDAMCTVLRRPNKQSIRTVLNIIKTENRADYVASTIILLFKKIYNKLRKGDK